MDNEKRILKALQAIEKNTADIAKELKRMNRDKPVERG